jgi:hypothetical protein
MREGVKAGALREADADLYPVLLMGMVRGALLRHLHGLGDAPQPDVAARLMRVFLRGAAREKGRRA